MRLTVTPEVGGDSIAERDEPDQFIEFKTDVERSFLFCLVVAGGHYLDWRCVPVYNKHEAITIGMVQYQEEGEVILAGLVFRFEHVDPLLE